MKNPFPDDIYQELYQDIRLEKMYQEEVKARTDCAPLFSRLTKQVQKSEEEEAIVTQAKHRSKKKKQKKAAASSDIKTLPPTPVSEERRKRDTLMGKRNMRYAFSTKHRVLHDRECPLAKEISDADFRMQEEFSEKMKLCTTCYRKAVIRSGLDPDHAKWLHYYELAFQRLGATNQDLYDLIIKKKANLAGVDMGTVVFQLNNDAWKIQKEPNEEFLLFHNNYRLIDDNENYERLLRKDFHFQRRYTGEDGFHLILEYIYSYSWGDHIERFQAEIVPEEIKKSVRKSLESVENYATMPAYTTMVSAYFCVIDCDNKISSKWESKKKQSLSEKYDLIICRVPRWEVADFKDALSALKQSVANLGYEDYPEVCKATLQTQPLPKPPRHW